MSIVLVYLPKTQVNESLQTMKDYTLEVMAKSI